MPRLKMTRQDALLVVDVQNDFCPGGRLPVPDGDQVVPVLNSWMIAAEEAGLVVVASRHWHPPRHLSFTERGGPSPAHCVKGTKGAEFHRDLRFPADVLIVSRGEHEDFDQLSAFDQTGLAPTLRDRDVRRLWVGGLAQEMSVRSTVLDALQEGFEVGLIVDATRPMEEAKGKAALGEMKGRGAVLWREGVANHV